MTPETPNNQFEYLKHSKTDVWNQLSSSRGNHRSAFVGTIWKSKNEDIKTNLANLKTFLRNKVSPEWNDHQEASTVLSPSECSSSEKIHHSPSNFFDDESMHFIAPIDSLPLADNAYVKYSDVDTTSSRKIDPVQGGVLGEFNYKGVQDKVYFDMEQNYDQYGIQSSCQLLNECEVPVAALPPATNNIISNHLDVPLPPSSSLSSQVVVVAIVSSISIILLLILLCTQQLWPCVFSPGDINCRSESSIVVERTVEQDDVERKISKRRSCGSTNEDTTNNYSEKSAQVSSDCDGAKRDHSELCQRKFTSPRIYRSVSKFSSSYKPEIRTQRSWVRLKGQENFASAVLQQHDDGSCNNSSDSDGSASLRQRSGGINGIKFSSAYFDIFFDSGRCHYGIPLESIEFGTARDGGRYASPPTTRHTLPKSPQSSPSKTSQASPPYNVPLPHPGGSHESTEMSSLRAPLRNSDSRAALGRGGKVVYKRDRPSRDDDATTTTATTASPSTSCSNDTTLFPQAAGLVYGYNPTTALSAVQRGEAEAHVGELERRIETETVRHEAKVSARVTSAHLFSGVSLARGPRRWQFSPRSVTTPTHQQGASFLLAEEAEEGAALFASDASSITSGSRGDGSDSEQDEQRRGRGRGSGRGRRSGVAVRTLTDERTGAGTGAGAGAGGSSSTGFSAMNRSDSPSSSSDCSTEVADCSTDVLIDGIYEVTEEEDCIAMHNPSKRVSSGTSPDLASTPSYRVSREMFDSVVPTQRRIFNSGGISGNSSSSDSGGRITRKSSTVAAPSASPAVSKPSRGSSPTRTHRVEHRANVPMQLLFPFSQVSSPTPTPTPTPTTSSLPTPGVYAFTPPPVGGTAQRTYVSPLSSSPQSRGHRRPSGTSSDMGSRGLSPVAAAGPAGSDRRQGRAGGGTTANSPVVSFAPATTSTSSPSEGRLSVNATKICTVSRGLHNCRSTALISPQSTGDHLMQLSDGVAMGHIMQLSDGVAMEHCSPVYIMKK